MKPANNEGLGSNQSSVLSSGAVGSQSRNPTETALSKPGTSTQAWYTPIFSPEHGVYMVLFVSFLTGAAVTQQWTATTSLVFLCAFAAFQAEHPLAMQIKQRRSWKPRFLFWGGLYASIALGIAGWLALKTPLLWWLYGATLAVIGIDAIAVYLRKQRSIFNEWITFAAVCLTAPFVFVATTHSINAGIIGLWILNACFFSSTIFTVKLRKIKTDVLIPGILYHTITTFIILALVHISWLTPITASAFGLALVRYFSILGVQDWYQTTNIQNVARIETLNSLLFLVITALSLLPTHLPSA